MLAIIIFEIVRWKNSRIIATKKQLYHATQVVVCDIHVSTHEEIQIRFGNKVFAFPLKVVEINSQHCHKCADNTCSWLETLAWSSKERIKKKATLRLNKAKLPIFY